MREVYIKSVFTPATRRFSKAELADFASRYFLTTRYSGKDKTIYVDSSPLTNLFAMLHKTTEAGVILNFIKLFQPYCQHGVTLEPRMPYTKTHTHIF